MLRKVRMYVHMPSHPLRLERLFWRQFDDLPISPRNGMDDAWQALGRGCLKMLGKPNTRGRGCWKAQSLGWRWAAYVLSGPVFGPWGKPQNCPRVKLRTEHSECIGSLGPEMIQNGEN